VGALTEDEGAARRGEGALKRYTGEERRTQGLRGPSKGFRERTKVRSETWFKATYVHGPSSVRRKGTSRRSSNYGPTRKKPRKAGKRMTNKMNSTGEDQPECKSFTGAGLSLRGSGKGRS